MSDDEHRIVVHLVHGTWGGVKAFKPGVVPWFMEGSDFERSVRKHLPEDMNRRLSFRPFTWSGANSFHARKSASEELFAKLVVAKSSNPSEHHILVGHSHGGTIIADAFMPFAEQAKNGLAYLATKVIGAVTMGTPFVVRTLSFTSEQLGGTLFLATTLPVLAFVIAIAAAISLVFHGQLLAAAAIAGAGLVALSGLWEWSTAKHGAWNGSRIVNLFAALQVMTIPIALRVMSLPVAVVLKEQAPPRAVVQDSNGETPHLLNFWPSLPTGVFDVFVIAVIICLLILLLSLIVLPNSLVFWPFTFRKLDWLHEYPQATDWPRGPKVPLYAIRLPGDEATFAINGAQFLVWLDSLIVGVFRWCREWMDSLSNLRLAVVLATAWLLGSLGVIAFHPQTPWWRAFVAVIYFSGPCLIMLLLLVAYLLICTRLATTIVLAIAVGPELLDGGGAIKVYAEPLPRWKEPLIGGKPELFYHQRITHWTADEQKNGVLPGLNHYLHELESVREQVAGFIKSIVREHDRKMLDYCDIDPVE